VITLIKTSNDVSETLGLYPAANEIVFDSRRKWAESCVHQTFLFLRAQYVIVQ